MEYSVATGVSYIINSHSIFLNILQIKMPPSEEIGAGSVVQTFHLTSTNLMGPAVFSVPMALFASSTLPGGTVWELFASTKRQTCEAGVVHVPWVSLPEGPTVFVTWWQQWDTVRDIVCFQRAFHISD